MTDNQIIKALKCCAEHVRNCAECPLNVTSLDHCSTRLAQNALDLIKRQKAEIEQYKDYNEKWMEKCDDLQTEIVRLQNEVTAKEWEYEDMLEQRNSVENKLEESLIEAKAEAIQGFADRLKENTIEVDVSFGYGKEHYTEAVTLIEIDNLVKEMISEKCVNNTQNCTEKCETTGEEQ